MLGDLTPVSLVLRLEGFVLFFLSGATKDEIGPSEGICISEACSMWSRKRNERLAGQKRAGVIVRVECCDETP